MSLKLLVDEDSQDKILVAKLRDAEHDVLTAKEAGLLGQPDNVILARAIAEHRTILTRNCNDFLNEVELVKNSGGHHYGVLLRYEKNDPSKDMTYDEIIIAIANIVKAMSDGKLVLADQEISLSYYRY